MCLGGRGRGRGGRDKDRDQKALTKEALDADLDEVREELVCYLLLGCTMHWCKYIMHVHDGSLMLFIAVFYSEH